MKLRVIGTPDEVDLAFEVLNLTPLVRVEHRSRPYPCRDDADRVRVYVDLLPLTRLVDPGEVFR
ncbi:MAG: hypothetical protein JXA67_00080 [Micromonosporaceae bacterium]|nr:hypothetical protein [Micromonosporaceae bacterium]